MRPKIFVTQPVAESALERLRAVADVKVNPVSSRVIAHKALVAAARKHDIVFSLLHANRVAEAYLGLSDEELKLARALSIGGVEAPIADHVERLLAAPRGHRVSPCLRSSTSSQAFRGCASSAAMPR